MATNSLTDLISFINLQISTQETQREHLSKAKALISVALGEDFVNFEKSVIYDYLWVLNDLIAAAHDLGEKTLSAMLQINSPQPLAEVRNA